MRPGSEIIFLLVFHSHHQYLFRREKNLELYIVIFLYRKKKKRFHKYFAYFGYHSTQGIIIRE